MSDLRALHGEYQATGSAAARDAIVAHHLPLARQLATAFAGRGEPFDDLHQVARLALIRALDRYDPDRGAFWPFASRCMAGALKRHYRDRCWTVRPSRRMHDLSLAAKTAREDLVASLRREPTTDELACWLAVTSSEVLEAQVTLASYRTVPLDAPSSRSDEAIVDRIGAEDSAFDETEARLDARRAAAALLDTLPPEMRRVVELYFFDGMRQKEIAALLGTNQVRVSRQIARALHSLRALGGAGEGPVRASRAS